MKIAGIALALVLLASTLTVFANAEKFDYTKCVLKIPKDATYAERRIEQNKCRDKASDIQNEKITQQNLERKIWELTKKNDLTCEKEYDKFKILGETKYRAWKYDSQSNADICIALFKDPVWNYKGSDRDQKIFEWAQKYYADRELKAQDARTKSTGKTVGKATTMDLEDLEKRLTAKIEKLEKENKKLKEKIKK